MTASSTSATWLVALAIIACLAALAQAHPTTYTASTGPTTYATYTTTDTGATTTTTGPSCADDEQDYFGRCPDDEDYLRVCYGRPSLGFDEDLVDFALYVAALEKVVSSAQLMINKLEDINDSLDDLADSGYDLSYVASSTWQFCHTCADTVAHQLEQTAGEYGAPAECLGDAAYDDAGDMEDWSTSMGSVVV